MSFAQGLLPQNRKHLGAVGWRYFRCSEISQGHIIKTTELFFNGSIITTKRQGMCAGEVSNRVSLLVEVSADSTSY
jgi:hypothetical protein